MFTLPFLVCMVNLLHAQDAPRKLSDYPPPRAPFVSAVPDKASWTTMPLAVVASEGDTSPSAMPKSKPRVARIDSAKSGELKRDIISYESGAREEVWYVQGQVLSNLSKRPDKVIVQNVSALDDPGDARGVFRLLGSPTKSTGYPGLKWLDKKYYDGVVLFNKTTPAYHYVLKGKDPETGADLIAAEAWIHAETGRPVAYSAEGTVYAYTFAPEPGEPLALPSAFQGAYLKVQQTLARQKQLEVDAAALR